MEWICSNLKTIYCTEAEVAKMRRALEPLCKDLFHRSLNGTVMETDLPLDMIQRYLAFANEPLWNDEEVSKKTTKEPFVAVNKNNHFVGDLGWSRVDRKEWYEFRKINIEITNLEGY